jgi:hypothetical protein
MRLILSIETIYFQLTVKKAHSLYTRDSWMLRKANRFLLFHSYGLMTFDHRKPDLLNYERSLPLVDLTMDTKWDPHASYDDLGKLGIDPLESEVHAGRAVMEVRPHKVAATPNLSKWKHDQFCGYWII